MTTPLLSDSFAFDDTTAFSWTNAFGCIRAARLAYENKATIGQQLSAWAVGREGLGWQFIDDQAKGTQAFVMTTDQIILVAFRGTDEPRDWIANKDIDLIAGPLGGEVHEGFSEALTPVWDTIKETIVNFRGIIPFGS